MPGQSLSKITERGVLGLFYQELERGDRGWVDRLAFRVDSNSANEEHAWLGAIPRMREWIGGRGAHQMREFSFVIANAPYESTIEIHEDDLTADKTGQLQARLGELAASALELPAERLSALIADGESAVCYDGQYYFDTDHAIGEATGQSNDIVQTVTTATAPTVAEFRDAVLAAVQQIHTFKDDRGRPVNTSARSFDVMVPVPFFAVAMQALTMPVISDGTGAVTNVLPSLDGYTFRPVVNPRLDWTTKFAVFRADGRAKPFILQERKPLRATVLGEGSDHHFDTGNIKVSVDWAGGFGFGLWQHACLVTFST